MSLKAWNVVALALAFVAGCGSGSGKAMDAAGGGCITVANGTGGTAGADASAAHATYRIESITYAGPPLAAPFRLTVVPDGSASSAPAYQSSVANCDLNMVFTTGLQSINAAVSTPYSVGQLTVAFDAGTQGTCGTNSTGPGTLTVVHTASTGRVSTTYCGTCGMGQVFACANAMLAAAVADMNAGR